MKSLNFRIGCVAGLLFKWFLLVLSFLCLLRISWWAPTNNRTVSPPQAERGRWVVVDRKHSCLLLSSHSCFPWPWAWTAPRRWVPIPGKDVALGSVLLEPSALRWRLEALSFSSSLRGSTGEPVSASLGLGWVHWGKQEQTGTEKEELPGSCEVNTCLKQIRTRM